MLVRKSKVSFTISKCQMDSSKWVYFVASSLKMKLALR